MVAPLGGRGAPHRPVLLRETIEFLAVARGGLFVDGTVGLGGHSEAILEASNETRVIGIDLDTEALLLARQRLARFGSRFRAVQANFRDIARLLADAEEKEASGILVDYFFGSQKKRLRESSLNTAKSVAHAASRSESLKGEKGANP